MGERRFTNVAVLKGGISSEREVSLRSGGAIANGLREGGYIVHEIDMASRELELPEQVEAVFIALHGWFGEDGEVQQILMEKGVPFTGSGIESCRLSFDKVLTRNRLLEHGLPVPQGEVVHASEQRTISIPFVVKPSREGSSVGCHLVRENSGWKEAFSDSSRFSGDVLVEEYIAGREFTVGVLNGMVLPVVEIIPEVEWFDYDAKYVTGDTRYEVPARLGKAVAEEMQHIALEAFNCLEASDFGRVDFRLSPDNKPYILELNAIPGFTETSLLPKAAQAAGIGFSELCCRIMELAHL